MSCVPWEILEHFDNIDDIVTVCKSLVLEILDKHAPIKSHIVKKIYQSESLTSERKKCKLNGNTGAYKKLRNKVTYLIEIAKKKTYRSQK